MPFFKKPLLVEMKGSKRIVVIVVGDTSIDACFSQPSFDRRHVRMGYESHKNVPSCNDEVFHCPPSKSKTMRHQGRSNISVLIYDMVGESSVFIIERIWLCLPLLFLIFVIVLVCCP